METTADPVATLPRYIAIKAEDGNYLSLTSTGLLSFIAPQKTRLTTHEVLYNEDEPTFLIRSQNNCFWRRDSSNWIYANWEGQPPTAVSKEARFKLVKLLSGKLALQSAMDDRYLKRYDMGNTRGYNAVMRTLDRFAEVEVSDAYEYALSLPQYLHLKGDNDRYIRLHHERNLNWLKYHGNDHGNLWGTFEVHHLLDGSIALYNLQADRFWSNSTNWIWADASRNEFVTNKRCHFEPVMLGRNLVAFRSNFNTRFCMRLTEYWRDCMNAGASSTNEAETRHTLSEAVVERNVFNVRYLLNLASTSDHMVMMVARGSADNRSPFTIDLKVTATVLRTATRTRSWSNSFTFSQSVTTSFRAGKPFVAEGGIKVEIGFEQNFSNEWGESTEENIGFETEYTVPNVPPGGTASVVIICSMAKMRLPFTYRSRDTAPDGAYKEARDFIDGIYEGVDVYDIHAEITGSTLRGGAVEKIALVPVDASKSSYVVPDGGKKTPIGNES